MRIYFLSAVLAVGAIVMAVGKLPAAVPQRAPAIIDVTLPADAKLTIDGHATRSTSEYRQFITPPLEAGKTFRYAFRDEFVRAGRTVTVEQNVFVRAGRATFVSLNLPEASRSFYEARSENRAYYYPDSLLPAGAGRFRSVPAPVIVNLSGRPVFPGGFRPMQYGADQSDPFYHSGQ